MVPIAFRLRIVPDYEVDNNPNEFFVCVARNNVSPQWRQPFPEMKPARLEAFNQMNGLRERVEVMRD